MSAAPGVLSRSPLSPVRRPAQTADAMEHSGCGLEGLGHGLAPEPTKAGSLHSILPGPYLTLWAR